MKVISRLYTAEIPGKMSHLGRDGPAYKSADRLWCVGPSHPLESFAQQLQYSLQARSLESPGSMLSVPSFKPVSNIKLSRVMTSQ